MRRKYLPKLTIYLLILLIPARVISYFAFQDKIYHKLHIGAYGNVAKPLYANASFHQAFDNLNPSVWDTYNLQGNTANISNSNPIANSNNFLEFNYATQYIDVRKNYTVTNSENALFAVDVYDSGFSDDTASFIFGLDTSGASNGSFIGIKKDNSQYIYRINGVTSDSGVPRQVGWRSFRLIKRGQELLLFIDNNLIRKEVYSNAWSQIKMVSSWNDFGKVRLDNVVFAKLPQSYSFDSLVNDVLDDTLHNYGQSVILADVSEGKHLRIKANILETSLTKKIKNNNFNFTEDLNYLREILSDSSWQISTDNFKWSKSIQLASLVRSVYLMRSQLSEADFALVESLVTAHISFLQGKGPSFNNDVVGHADYYKTNTHAEDNAWDAAFLATVANLLPALDPNNSIEALSRCFAFHTISPKTTNPVSYCGRSGYTVGSDFIVYNHNARSPHYANTVVNLLSQAALSYKLTGKMVPGEFYRNIIPTMNKAEETVNRDDWYYYENGQQIADWSGLNRAAFTNLTNYFFPRTLYGATPPTTLTEYLNSRLVLYPYISALDARKVGVVQSSQFVCCNDMYEAIVNSHNSASIVAMAYYQSLTRNELSTKTPIQSGMIDTSPTQITLNPVNLNGNTVTTVGSGSSSYQQVVYQSNTLELESSRTFVPNTVVSMQFKAVNPSTGKFLFGITGSDNNRPGFYLGSYLAGTNAVRKDGNVSGSDRIDFGVLDNNWHTLSFLITNDKTFAYIDGKFVNRMSGPSFSTGKIRLVFSWNAFGTYHFRHPVTYTQ